MNTKSIPILIVLALAGCGGDGPSTGGGGGGGGNMSTGGNGATFYCCLNGAFFSCPSQQAVDKCVPPNFMTQPDPSSCTRNAGKDSTCASNGGHGGGGGGGSGGGGGGGAGGGGGGGGSSGAKPGDLCDASSTYCAGNVLLCVERQGDASGTCRSPCDPGHSCIGQGLSFNSCCPLTNAATSVCIPNDQVPSGANCGP